MTYQLSAQTRDIRIAAMQAAMDRSAADAIVFAAADFIQYATNFAVDVLPWERPIFAIVTRDGTTHAVFNELSTNHLRFSRAKGTLWLAEDQVHTYSEHPRSTHILPTLQELPKLLASVLGGLGLAGKKLLCDAVGPILTAALRDLPAPEAG